MRANFYVSMKIINFDEATWKRGIVYVCDELGAPPLSTDHARKMLKWAPMYFSFPGKLNCCHYCVENTAITGFIHVVLKIIPKEMRLRFRFHFGTFIRVCVCVCLCACCQVRFSVVFYSLPLTTLCVVN